MTKAGYAVTVLSDAVTSYDKNKILPMLVYYENKGRTLKTAAEVID